MTFVIKRIRNRLYVYEQYREGNIVVTKYIGPLEKIARKYQLYMQGVNYMLTQRDIDWMKKEIAKEVVNMILDARNKGTEWRRGRDSNPGAPVGQRISNPSPLAEPRGLLDQTRPPRLLCVFNIFMG